MTDDLGLPGRRELPPEVLDNVLASVRAGMGKPVRRRWPIVAAAAAVVLVLAGALVASVVIRETGPGPIAAPDPDFTLDQAAAKAGLDRCWAAVQTQGKAASFPARADWVPLFTKGTDARDSVGVVAALAGDKPFFCETTATTVTVTDPNTTPAYAAGTKTGTLLMSPNGTVAGVADPGWRVLDVTGRTEGGSSFASDAPVSQHGNLFVELTNSRPSRTTYSVGPHTEDRGLGERGAYEAPHVLPAAPAPAVSITDRPVTPAPDRTSAAGALLGACLAGSDDSLTDEGAYHATVMLAEGEFRVVLARFGDKYALCQRDIGYQGRPPRYRLFADPFALPSEPARKLRGETLGGAESTGNEGGPSWTPFAGVVSRDAAQISIDFGAGYAVDAAVTDGMFAVWIPKAISWDDPNAMVPIIVRDAALNVLYQGTLPLH